MISCTASASDCLLFLHKLMSTLQLKSWPCMVLAEEAPLLTKYKHTRTCTNLVRSLLLYESCHATPLSMQFVLWGSKPASNSRTLLVMHPAFMPGHCQDRNGSMRTSNPFLECLLSTCSCSFVAEAVHIKDARHIWHCNPQKNVRPSSIFHQMWCQQTSDTGKHRCWSSAAAYHDALSCGVLLQLAS